MNESINQSINQRLGMDLSILSYYPSKETSKQASKQTNQLLTPQEAPNMTYCAVEREHFFPLSIPIPIQISF